MAVWVPGVTLCTDLSRGAHDPYRTRLRPFLVFIGYGGNLVPAVLIVVTYTYSLRYLT